MNEKVLREFLRNIGLGESDADDVITNYNQIYAHDMIQPYSGYDWVRQARKHKSRAGLNTVIQQGAAEFGRNGQYHLVGEAEELSDETTVETNKEDPRVRSTEPKFNSCPAYIHGMCRVDGRVCAWSNLDPSNTRVDNYRDCGKYYIASTVSPELWEIPFGRERAAEYLIGLKA